MDPAMDPAIECVASKANSLQMSDFGGILPANVPCCSRICLGTRYFIPKLLTSMALLSHSLVASNVVAQDVPECLEPMENYLVLVSCCSCACLGTRYKSLTLKSLGARYFSPKSLTLTGLSCSFVASTVAAQEGSECCKIKSWLYLGSQLP